MRDGDSAGMAPRSPADLPLEALLTPAHFDVHQLFGDERFPNVVVALDGTVVATWGAKSLLVRRSEDGGDSWGPAIAVGAGIHAGGVTVDEASGEILFFGHPGHPATDGTPVPRTLYRSRDAGLEWIEAEAEFGQDDRGFLPSLHMSEHGITLRRGERAGRLLRPARVYLPDGGGYNTAIFSDDRGDTWQASQPFPVDGTGEGCVVELSDGRVFYSSRRHKFAPGETLRPERLHAWSDDGGATWRDPGYDEALPDGPRYRGEEGRGANYNGHFGMAAGLTRLPVAGRDILLYSNADHDGHERVRLTVWGSFDGGATWPLKRLVDGGPSAYSSLEAGRPGTSSAGWIYLQYEEREGGGRMARFNLAWLLDGQVAGELPDWLP